ncbi:unnamed protein product [Effrenium voratum]|nr:unnamed protein product [Effrenium voratum]
MVRASNRLLVSAVLAVGAFTLTRLCFVAPPPAVHQPLRQSHVALQARGGGEYDVSDADIDAFYNSLLTGSGGDPPKGTVLSELIVKFFHGDFTPQGFKRYSGLWKGPPPGNIGKKDIAIGVEKLKEQMANPMFVTKGGVGYGVDETQKVVDDGKGWVWLAAEMSPGGLAVELFKAVPYGKRAVLVAKQNNVAELFDKVWIGPVPSIFLPNGDAWSPHRGRASFSGPVCIPWSVLPAIVFFFWKFVKPLLPEAWAQAIERQAAKLSEILQPYLEKVPGFGKKKKAPAGPADASVQFGQVGELNSAEHLDKLLARSQQERAYAS